MIPSERPIHHNPECVDLTRDNAPRVFPVKPGDHAPAALRATFQTSLKLLSPLKARVLYLHAPDRSTPFEETLREVNELYKEGHLCVFLSRLDMLCMCKVKGANRGTLES